MNNYNLITAHIDTIESSTHAGTKEGENSKREQREAALNEGRLYYRELMGTNRNVAYNLFTAMDQDGDGRVSVNEVIAFVTENGTPDADTRRVFEGMGLTGNQSLSIEDVVAFGYIFMVWPSCEKCRSIIFDMYYTCMPCHNKCTNGQGADTYDLCPTCYKSGDFLHGHGPFQQIFHGGGQGTAMSYNQELQRSTSVHGEGQGEGTQKFSKHKILQILTNLSTLGTAVGSAGAYIAEHGDLAATAATVACSIM